MRSVARDGARRECDRSLARMHEAAANASMITVTEHRARREAELSDQRRVNGATLSSLDGVPVDLAREALRLAAAKLPIKTRFIQRIVE